MPYQSRYVLSNPRSYHYSPYSVSASSNPTGASDTCDPYTRANVIHATLAFPTLPSSALVPATYFQSRGLGMNRGPTAEVPNSATTTIKQDKGKGKLTERISSSGDHDTTQEVRSQAEMELDYEDDGNFEDKRGNEGRGDDKENGGSEGRGNNDEDSGNSGGEAE